MSHRLPRGFFTQPCTDLAQQLLGKVLVRVMDDGETRVCGRIVETEAYLGIEDKAAHTYGGKRTPKVESMYKVGGHSYVYPIYGMYLCLNISAEQEGIGNAVLIRALEPVEGKELMTVGRQSKGGLKSSGRLPLPIAASSASSASSSSSAAKRSVDQISDSEPAPETNTVPLPPSIVTKPMKLTELCSGPGKLCQALHITRALDGVDMSSENSEAVLFVEDDGFSVSEIVAAKRIGIDYAGEVWANKLLRFYIKGNPHVSVVAKEKSSSGSSAAAEGSKSSKRTKK